MLDIGCNGGFYSIEMKRRGAERVLGIDVDDRYLNQARFAAETLGLEIEFEKRSVYEVDAIAGQFDYVFFMGVFYHLRYPLFALDKVIKKVAPGGQAGVSDHAARLRRSEAMGGGLSILGHRDVRRPDCPAMYFVEHSYANDPTNWWIPNRARGRGDVAQLRTGDSGPSRIGNLDLHASRARCAMASTFSILN